MQRWSLLLRAPGLRIVGFGLYDCFSVGTTPRVAVPAFRDCQTVSSFHFWVHAKACVPESQQGAFCLERHPLHIIAYTLPAATVQVPVNLFSAHHVVQGREGRRATSAFVTDCCGSSPLQPIPCWFFKLRQQPSSRRHSTLGRQERVLSLGPHLEVHHESGTPIQLPRHYRSFRLSNSFCQARHSAIQLQCPSA